MKVAALYDIHGNLPALEAVLEEIDVIQPDRILLGGDGVFGPFPRATLERLLSMGDKAVFIRGNCDREAVAAFDDLPLDPSLPEEIRAVTIWSAKQLERNQRDFLAGLQERVVLDIDGVGEVLFCHGSPRSDEEIITSATPVARLEEILADVRPSVVVCGHTHMQFDRVINGTRLVNAGSVGMPYGGTGAYWLLLGPEIMLRRTPYDLERAAARIRASSYPAAQDFVDNNVLHPPSEAEAIELFERLATERS